MKKYGKFEKKPKAKNALLQAYFTGLFSLVLCVTMFFGTSYAWFTSDVNNAENEIYIGTLDVGLFRKDGEEWQDLSDNSNKLFDGSIRWEPGYTALETVKIVNEGDLAFKYVLTFTDGALAEGSQLSIENVAEFFDVWVYDHLENAENADAVSEPASYLEIVAAGSGWENAGSLDRLLAGDAVFDGDMDAVRDEDDETPANEGTTDGLATENTYTVALHMKEETDFAVMGQRISLNVKLVAYQKTAEADGFGSEYDQMVATEAQLRAAFANGGKVALAADIKLTESLSVASNKAVILDMNGHSITQTKECTDSYAMISNNGELTVTGNGRLSFTDTGAGDPSFGWGTYTIRNSGKLTVENGVIEHLGEQVFGNHCIQAIFQYAGSTVINGGTVSCPGYRSVRLWSGDMTINGGTFVGQVWVQCVDDTVELTVNGGAFAPSPNGDLSCVFVNNKKPNGTDVYAVSLLIAGGEFETKIGADMPEALAGCITGGQFTEAARENTNPVLFAD